MPRQIELAQRLHHKWPGKIARMREGELATAHDACAVENEIDVNGARSIPAPSHPAQPPLDIEQSRHEVDRREVSQARDDHVQKRWRPGRAVDRLRLMNPARSDDPNDRMQLLERPTQTQLALAEVGPERDDDGFSARC